MSIATAKRIYHLSGLSTETKLIPNDISTGSTYIETDTGATFVYNTSNGWVRTSSGDIATVEAQTIGIKEIAKTSSKGLVDTYTIFYTNGAETTFTVSNGTPIYTNVDIKNPKIDNKLYNIGIGTDLTGKNVKILTTSEVLRLDRLPSVRPEADNLISKSIEADIKAYWPRIEEGRFILNIDNYKSLNFSFAGTVEDPDQTGIFESHKVDLWQAFDLDEATGKFIRYVGHFEAEHPWDEVNSKYYFTAQKQAISFNSLKEQADGLNVRLTKAEDDIAKLHSEDERLDVLDTEVADLNARLAKETARAIVFEGAIKAGLDQTLDNLDAKIEKKADSVNTSQTILARKYEIGFRRPSTSADVYPECALTAVVDANNNYDTNIKTMSSDYILANNLNANVTIAGNYTEVVGNSKVTDTGKTIGNKKVTVVNNLTEKVGGNVTEEYAADKTTTIVGKDTYTAAEDVINVPVVKAVLEDITVDAINNVDIKTNININTKEVIGKITGNENKTVTGNETEIVKGNETKVVEGTSETTIEGLATDTFNGGRLETVNGAVETTITGNVTTKVIGTNDLNITENSTETFAKNRNISVGDKLSINAPTIETETDMVDVTTEVLSVETAHLTIVDSQEGLVNPLDTEDTSTLILVDASADAEVLAENITFTSGNITAAIEGNVNTDINGNITTDAINANETLSNKTVVVADTSKETAQTIVKKAVVDTQNAVYNTVTIDGQGISGVADTGDIVFNSVNATIELSAGNDEGTTTVVLGNQQIVAETNALNVTADSRVNLTTGETIISDLKKINVDDITNVTIDITNKAIVSVTQANTVAAALTTDGINKASIILTPTVADISVNAINVTTTNIFNHTGNVALHGNITTEGDEMTVNNTALVVENDTVEITADTINTDAVINQQGEVYIDTLNSNIKVKDTSIEASTLATTLNSTDITINITNRVNLAASEIETSGHIIHTGNVDIKECAVNITNGTDAVIGIDNVALTADYTEITSNSIVTTGVVTQTGNVAVTGTVNVSDSLTADGKLTINNDADITGALTVTGAITSADNATISGTTQTGTLKVTGTSEFDGTTVMNDDLEVKADIKIADGDFIVNAANNAITETVANKTVTIGAEFVTNATNDTINVTNLTETVTEAFTASAKNYTVNVTNALSETAKEIVLTGTGTEGASGITLNAPEIIVSTSHIVPESTGITNVGSSTKAFKQVYATDAVVKPVTDGNGLVTNYTLTLPSKTDTIAVLGDITNASSDITNSLATTAEVDTMLNTVFGWSYETPADTE